MTSRGSSYWTSGSVPLVEPEFLESILAAASDLALVVAADATVMSAIVSAREDDSFGNLSHWEGRPISEFLTPESREKFATIHAAYLAGTEPTRPVELNHADNALWKYPVCYTLHRFGQNDAVLLLGRDLRPIAETQQQLVQAQIALEQGYEARREYDTRYRVVLNASRDAILFVSVTGGRVDDANERAAELLGLKPEALSGASLGSLFDNRSSAELTEALITATLGEEAGVVPLTATRTGLDLIATPNLFRANGQRVLLCRLSRAVAPAQPEKPDSVASLGGALFTQGSDAMAFLDPKGSVLAVNDAFLDMTGVPHRSEALGRSFADFMARGQIDLGLMLGASGGEARSGKVRIYATRLVNQLGARFAVEASVTRIDTGASDVIALILRDAERLEPVRRPGEGESLPEAGHKVVELVGSATLKEIVTETTDVVEKMCIETAVNLTRNNRVAAAEMLGLSRQSLYVKLRKYGLLNKNG